MQFIAQSIVDSCRTVLGRVLGRDVSKSREAPGTPKVLAPGDPRRGVPKLPIASIYFALAITYALAGAAAGGDSGSEAEGDARGSETRAGKAVEAELGAGAAEDVDARLRPPNPLFRDSTLVARVGNETVTAGDLYYALDNGKGIDVTLPPDSLRATLLEKTVSQKLLVGLARERGLERSPTIVGYANTEEEKMVNRELVRRIYEGKLDISTAELEEIYDRYHYTLRVLHLNVDRRDLADQLRERLVNGEDFGDLARTYSEDKKTAKTGGDMGEVMAGRMIIHFEDAVFTIQPGELTPVIKGRGENYKIFKLLSKERNRTPPGTLDSMRQGLMKRVRVRKSGDALNAWQTATIAKYGLVVDEENFAKFAYRLRNQISSFEAINSIQPDSVTTAWIFSDWPEEELALPILRWNGGQFTIAEFNKESRALPTCPTCMWRDSDVQLRLFALGRAFDRLYELEKRAIRMENVPHIHEEVERRKEARMAEMVAAGLYAQGSEITEAEARSYWEEHKSEFKRSPRAKVRRILVDSEQEAQDIVERLRGGADFAALAERFSKDETTNRLGGETGFFRPGTMHGMADVVFQHQPGDLIPPFQSKRGWEVVQVIEFQAPAPVAFEDVQQEIKERLMGQRHSTQLQGLLAELRASTPIAVDAAALARISVSPS
jgi:parvulin-like peptidyl-prolyl isomerase